MPPAASPATPLPLSDRQSRGGGELPCKGGSMVSASDMKRSLPRCLKAQPVHRLAQLLDRLGRLFQRSGFLRGQLELHDFLDPVLPEFCREADEQAVAPVILALRKNRGGQDYLFVQQDRFAHLDGRRRGSVVGRARLE